MFVHTVEPGECLSSIAGRYHIASWRTIFYDPQNADLRRKRPDPNVLYPGDRLVIPDILPKEVAAGTEQRHRFVLSRDRTLLRIVLKDEHEEPFALKRCVLKISDLTLEGTTDRDGLFEQEIPDDVDEAELTLILQEDPDRKFYVWPLRIGWLDPVEEITGLQARLNNLGFDCGEVDGVAGPRTAAAVRVFQAHCGLAVDGIAGPRTLDKLKEVHGC